ncbi:MAG: hypothetical protein WCI18_13635 [Pseudomonadota bacterium]
MIYSSADFRKLIFYPILSILTLSSFGSSLFALENPTQGEEKKPASAVASREREACDKILQYTFQLAKELYSYSRKASESPLARKISQSSGLSCGGAGQSAIVQVGLELLETQSPRIGVLGPTGESTASFEQVIEGIKLSTGPLDFNKKFLVRRHGKTKEQILEQLADLIFVDRVGMLIGGSSQFEMESIEKYTKGLMVLLLGIGDTSPGTNPWLFRIAPGPDILVDGVLEGLSRAQAKRIAVLAPETATETINDIQSKAAIKDISVSALITYKPRNFQSLDSAIQQLLKISTKGREQEYRDLVEKKQTEADLEQVPLNLESIRLPPIQDFDYLFVPDDFKMVRHILKILRFHGVTQVKLAGNHLWRSPNLASPWDQFLSQSFFVDFIGSYLNLPFKVDVEPKNPLFLSGLLASQIDSRLLGYRAGGIAQRVLEFPDSRHRIWPKQLLERPIDQTGFPSQIAFKEGRSARWPIYLFTPTSSGIILAPSWPDSAGKKISAH